MGPIRAQGNRRRWGGRQGNETARSLPARKNWRHEQLKAHQYGSLPGENYCVWGQEDVVSAPPWCRGRGLGMQLLQLPRLWGRPELRDGRAALKTRAVELLLLPKGVGTQCTATRECFSSIAELLGKLGPGEFPLVCRCFENPLDKKPRHSIIVDPSPVELLKTVLQPGLLPLPLGGGSRFARQQGGC